MIVGDALWCRLALHQPRRWVRWSAVAFGVAQFAGLVAVLLSRFGLSLEEALPRWAYSTILSWHLVILLPWLAWRLMRLLVGLAAKAARAMRRSAPPAPAGSPAMNRRDFIGVAAAFTPPLLSFGAAAIGEAQLDGFRVRRIRSCWPQHDPRAAHESRHAQDCCRSLRPRQRPRHTRQITVQNSKPRPAFANATGEIGGVVCGLRRRIDEGFLL